MNHHRVHIFVLSVAGSLEAFRGCWSPNTRKKRERPKQVMISVCVTEVKSWVGKRGGGVSGGGGRRQSWKAKLLQTQIAKAKQEGQQQEVARHVVAVASRQRRLMAEKVGAPG